MMLNQAGFSLSCYI